MGPCFRRDDYSKVQRHDRRAMSSSMQRYFKSVIRSAAIASVLWAALPYGAFAATGEPTDGQIDTAPCVAALTASDDDKIIASCGVLIDNDKAPKPDRVKALIARAV